MEIVWFIEINVRIIHCIISSHTNMLILPISGYMLSPSFLLHAPHAKLYP
jgi:hypothetical protein